jgi:hypothetical protein
LPLNIEYAGSAGTDSLFNHPAANLHGVPIPQRENLGRLYRLEQQSLPDRGSR